MKTNTHARLLGLAAALLTMAAILWTLFAEPTIGVRSSGSMTLAQGLGLEYDAQRMDEYGRLENYAYQEMAYSTLILSAPSSMGAAVALVRLCTHPFGLEFSTRFLAVAYALVISLGAYWTVSGLARRSPMVSVMALLFFPLLMLHPALTAYLNSLYPIGAAMAYLTLFVGATVHVLCQDKGKGWQGTLLVTLTGLLLLRSMPQMLVFLPAVVLAVVFSAVHTCPGKPWRALHAFCTVLLGAMCLMGVYTGFVEDTEISSSAANYLAVFQGYLPAAEDPSALLNDLGLPEDYLADVGKSYYDPADTFACDPNQEENRALLDSTISLQKRLIYGMTHPGMVADVLRQNETVLQDAYGYAVVNDEGETRQLRLSPFAVLETMFGTGGVTACSVRLLLGAALLLALTVLVRHRAGERRLCLTLALLLICATLYLPLSVILTGKADLLMLKVLLIWLSWAALMVTAACAVVLAQQVMTWLSREDTHLTLPRPSGVERAECTVLQHLRALPMNRRLLLWATAAMCVVLCCWQLLPAEHIGGVNNGDYGRMMEQIDLYWMPEQLADTSTQMSAQVVEDYSYREPFHPVRLTSADPTYSLLFPSMLVRFFSLFTDGGYSTQIQAFVLLALTVASILLILHDLYPLLGRVTLLPALLLPCVLLGENYVAWYNSLFGETMIPVGLMITIACAVHLAMMPRGHRRSWLWMVLLAIGIRLLCTAKAQMALALPAGIILLVSFAVYHRPKETKRMAAFLTMSAVLTGLVSWDAIGVYRKNQGVSEEQTIWQSVFYGALMIADDPDAAMEELGIPPEMKADIGKHAYYDSNDYVYPIGSEELREKLYDHVSTITMVKYYLRHPKDLLTMMDRAAQESVELSASFMTYTGVKYSENHALHRFNLWRNLRSLFAARAFWQYVVLYGAVVGLCAWLMVRRKTPMHVKLLALLLLCVMFIGVMQYPLSVIGNGFADNNKQMYTFMLCHDLMVVAGLTVTIRKLIPVGALERREGREEGGMQHAQKEESV